MTKLERGDVPLEESIAIYERGEALKKRCEALLARRRGAGGENPRAGGQGGRRRAVRREIAGGGSSPVSLLGVPVDFILFGLTLIGVAVFHHHTLRVSLTGLAAIATYKLSSQASRTGRVLAGSRCISGMSG